MFLECSLPVVFQAMVFGNMGDTSGTGVLFTRNPTNGVHELYGEYLLNAQGEDVVAGTDLFLIFLLFLLLFLLSFL
jgi:phosphoenolpyruvate synthase/pyruvate phosphate dikinase